MKKGNILSTNGAKLGNYEYDSSDVMPFILVNVLGTVTKPTVHKDGKKQSIRPKAFSYTDHVISWDKAEAFIRDHFDQEVIIEENT